MKKTYKIIFLLILFVFLSTYNDNKIDLISSEKKNFFQIQNIKITNNSLIKSEDVEEKLGHIYNKNIFFIKRNEIALSLNKIDFLEKIEVKKKYPNTIIVKIYETKPLAIIFKDKNKYLIDSSSRLVSYNFFFNISELPEIFGENAESNFIKYYNNLKKNNFPTNKIKSFYYFQIDRWDLQLEDNKTIKFPANNIEDAIKKSIELINRDDFKKYNIIDLRVDGKIIVE